MLNHSIFFFIYEAGNKCPKYIFKNMQMSFGYNGLARLQKHDKLKTKKWNES